MGYYVYILTNFSNSVFYVGCTNNIERRLSEHFYKLNLNSFTKKYKINKLVYYEHHDDFHSARQREYLMKRWRRLWKYELIETQNPRYENLLKDFPDVILE